MLAMNVELHNVTELLPVNGGQLLCRLPRDVAERLDTGTRDSAAIASTGCEIRFRLDGGGASITLGTLDKGPFMVRLMYGSFEAGWTHTSYPINCMPTTLTFQSSVYELELLRVTREKGLPYSPLMLRVLLPGTPVILYDTFQTRPPEKGDSPSRTILFYGSSITHGSLATHPNTSWPSLVANALKCDTLNLGMAGRCRMESDMARHIAGRNDWDCAMLELGVNVAGEFSEKKFRRRVSEFLHIMKTAGRPVYVTDIFGKLSEDPSQLPKYRDIVCEESLFPYVPGPGLFDDPSLLSEDLVHPSNAGHQAIAQAILREPSLLSCLKQQA